MCFDDAPFAFRSIHVAPIFRTFEPFPRHVGAWKWLVEKHPIARKVFCAIENHLRPKEPAIDGPQPSYADFHALCRSGQNGHL